MLAGLGRFGVQVGVVRAGGCAEDVGNAVDINPAPVTAVAARVDGDRVSG